MIEYEKDIQWNLDPNFYNPVNLIEGVNNTIQNYAKNIAYNRVVNLNENIAIRLDASYENGLVFHVSCIVDPGANKYNTYTLADLIVRNDGNVKFIISGVDARIHKSEVKPNGICLPVNEELVAAALAQLGQRIDGPVFDNKTNIINKKFKDNKKNKTYEEIEKRVMNATMVLTNALKMEKENQIVR